MDNSDINFYFDPVCPYAWITSKWVRTVQAQRDYSVDWRLISLRLLNAHLDYDVHFPPGVEASHIRGLELLRVLARARARAEFGREAVGTLYTALGERIFDSEPVGGERLGARALMAPALEAARLPEALIEALDEPSWDAVVQTETDEALALTGKDVGTPILHFQPPDGVAFFGPVISRLPTNEQAVELWEHVIALARFPGFSELKRGLREQPQLRLFDITAGEIGVQEDWHGGSC
ncbi:MAG: hypothetical protein ACRDRX_03050 [Pseudonocardiaceae bacterium]